MTKRRILASALALLTGLAGLPALAQNISDPDLFGKSLKIAKEAMDEYGRCDNEAELARINRIGYELAQHAEYQKVPFTFSLVDMPVPNAFTLPGGQIFVTRGLIDLDLTDDMLANVLGHEIGHVALEHFQRMQRRATIMSVLSNVLLAGVIIGAEHGASRPNPNTPYDPRVGYGDDGRGSLIQGAAAASVIVNELLLRSYSREHETEADQEGQRLAAAAGYDPDGARQLWLVMTTKAPQAREYGYWQTHPFGEERQKAAQALKTTWKIEPKRPADDYRIRTQTLLANYLERQRPKADEAKFLKDAALATWPQGRTAETLRLEKLHAERDQELTKPLLSRNYGGLIRSYRKSRDTVAQLTPQSPFLGNVDSEIKDFDNKLKELYPRAVQVMKGGVYETSFLVSFLANFPQSPEVPQVTLALGDAYSRLGNETEAVTQYLAVIQAGDNSEARRARLGLRTLVPNLKQLAALQQMVDQDKDLDLKRAAADRLDTVAKAYDELKNGDEYLKRFPKGPHVPEVLDRLNVLADNLYGEVVLYQGVGDTVKAMERINQILTHAPLSPAAARLRDRAQLETPRAS
ncbi:MAG TPA: M48 family metalloprotease [Thermoanaerobaculia bacterium]|nr:M48 family metalloprotease [Thermoanaerobaculia bacterium]